MSNQRKDGKDTDHDVNQNKRANQPQPTQTIDPETGVVESAVPTPPAHFVSLQAQAAALQNHDVPMLQRQMLAGQIGQQHGNQHLQRLFDSTRLTVSHPGNAAEKEAEAVATQVAAGEQAQISQAPSADIHGSWLDDIGNAIGDWLDIRDNEEMLDEWEDYQDAMEELESFRSQTYSLTDHQPSTGRGKFNLTYTPSTNTLSIPCTCSFNFVNGSPTQFPSASADDLTWSDEESAEWKSNFLQTVSSTWSDDDLLFHCQKDWWESLQAKVSVSFVEAEEDPHFTLNITKIPEGETAGSSVRAPGDDTPGVGTFDSEDLTTRLRTGDDSTRIGQIPAVHEAGHMLGLADEYSGLSGEPAQSIMVESDFGHAVERGNDERIMSIGMDIQAEHGITFLEALREATDMSDEWGVEPKDPRPVPPDPSLLDTGDFPLPDDTGVAYA